MEAYASLLKNIGLKITPARTAVLSILTNQKKPVSVAILVESLAKKSINFSTVYRTLETLEQAGIIRKVLVSQKQSFYELVDIHDHHHLICTECEKVEEIELQKQDFKKVVLKKSKQFSQLSTKTIELFGVCNSCEK